MTRDEAASLIERAEGRICMRLTYRADGTIATGNCGARLRAARQRGMLAFVSMLVIVFAAQIWAQAFGLRALMALFGGESTTPSVTAADVPKAPPVTAVDVQRAPLVKIRRVREVEHIEMGDVPLEGL